MCSEKVDKFPVAVEHGDEKVRARNEIERAGWNQKMNDFAKKFRIFPANERKLWTFLSRKRHDQIFFESLFRQQCLKWLQKGDKGTS